MIMNKKDLENLNMNSIRFSLVLKAVIVGWSFYVAVTHESYSVSIFYLVVAAVFTGLFIFQLNYLRRKRREGSNDGGDVR